MTLNVVIQGQPLWIQKIITFSISQTYYVYNIEKKKGHTNVCFTFNLKVKYRIHVIYVGISEICTNENITIDTMLKFIACNHPEWSKVIQ